MNIVAILIYIFIIVLIAAAFISVFSSGKNIKNKFISFNYKRNLVVIYCIFLIFTAILFYFIHETDLISIKNFSDQIKHKASLYNFKELALKDQLDSSDAFKAKWKLIFDYNGNTLKIRDNSDCVTLIGIRKDVDDGKIEVINYINNYPFYGTDIRDKIKSPSIALIRDELMINNEPSTHNNDYNNSNVTEIRLNQFTQDFTIKQFLKNEPSYTFADIMPSYYWNIVYIRIPKSLKIDDPSNAVIDMIN